MSETLPMTAARHRWLVFLLPALLALGGIGLWAWQSRGAAAGPGYQTTAVETGPIELRVTATGTLSALVTVEVGSQVSGRVAALHADYNSPVRAGETIARIDPAVFEAAVQRAEANVAVARANVERAEIQAREAQRQAGRTDELIQRRLIAESEGDAAVAGAAAAAAELRAARASALQAEAALREAEANLRHTDIRAPTDGVVIARSVNVGQTVAASLQAPVLFTIAQDLRQMEVIAAISEADIGRLREGQAVRFTVDAYSGDTFHGHVRQIRNAANVVQNVVTYDAVIDVANPDLRLRPGMTANVSIIVAERTSVPRVPNAALRFRPPEADTLGLAPPGRGERTLWLLREGRLVPLAVRAGLSDGLYTELIDPPLQPEDRVVLGLVSREATAAQRPPQGRLRML